MRGRTGGAEPAPQGRWLSRLARPLASLLLASLVGCGDDMGTVAPSSEAGRARLSVDADADGNVTLPKQGKRRGGPPAGLKTARALRGQNGD